MTNAGGMKLRLAAAMALLAVTLAGCAGAGARVAAESIYDPFEPANRKVHEFNRRFDKAVFRPAAKGYTSAVPAPFVDSINYFADNLSMPSVFFNSVAQGNFRRAGKAALRFVVNSTLGVAGLTDPATALGIENVDTDFGATLYAWGVGEGPYVELPFYGPSTARDTVGLIADIVANPLNLVAGQELRRIGAGAKLLEYMGQRGRYSETVDSILYDSVDSYAQARTIYLQNRRFELAGGTGGAYVDIYEDPYAATGSSLDPYSDPSLDPYAQ